MGCDVDEFAALMDESLVEVDEVGPPFLIDGQKVVLKVFEEGRVEIGRLNGVPVLMLPVAAITDAHVSGKAFGGRREVGLVDGYAET